MSLTSIRSAAGIVLLAVAAAGCGTAAATHPASTQSKKASPSAAPNSPTAQSKVNMAKRHHRKATPVMTHTAPPTVQPPAAPPTTQAPPPPQPTTTTPAPPPTTSNPIPQNNGGDHDADNNGGPSDGDGNI
jgi:hypothetical protein